MHQPETKYARFHTISVPEWHQKTCPQETYSCLSWNAIEPYLLRTLDLFEHDSIVDKKYNDRENGSENDRENETWSNGDRSLK